MELPGAASFKEFITIPNKIEAPRTNRKRKVGHATIITASPYKNTLAEMKKQKVEKLEKQAERKKKSAEKKLLGEIKKHQKINKIDMNKNKTKRTATETQTIQSARSVETSAKEKKTKNLKTNKNIEVKKTITVSISAKNKKKNWGAEDKTQANDRDADGNPYTCIFCQEVYIFPPPEAWLQCDQCKLWCHEACSAGATDYGYTCDLCSQ